MYIHLNLTLFWGDFGWKNGQISLYFRVNFPIKYKEIGEGPPHVGLFFTRQSFIKKMRFYQNYRRFRAKGGLIRIFILLHYEHTIVTLQEQVFSLKNFFPPAKGARGPRPRTPTGPPLQLTFSFDFNFYP